jgi:hypothetical protein
MFSAVGLLDVIEIHRKKVGGTFRDAQFVSKDTRG